MENKLKVSVAMVTYGHENFIEEAINGVLIQECDFEIELVLVNDCSPDKTDVVIQNMLKTHPRASIINYIKHEKNIGMIPNWVFGLKQCKGKYIAICEGDDYWTDSYKLQKQVEFLETYGGYGMSYTACDRYYQEQDVYIEANLGKKIREEITFEKLLLSNPIKTCTTVVRSSLTEQFIKSMGRDILNFKMGDAPLWLFISMNHKIKFHNENTAVYRILENSATNVSAYKKLLFRMSRYKVSLFFLRQKFSFYIACKLFINFVKETPVLILKTILSFLGLYKPNKEKVIKKRIKNKG